MNRYDAARAHWLGRLTLSAKLGLIVAVFVIVICAVIGLFVLAYHINAGVRTYVGGEGLWSKGQKDAVYALTRYLDQQNERDYQSYLSAIALPLGDRDARLAMEQPVLDAAAATAGFAQGGNAADDIPYMIFLFRYFAHLPFFAQAITIWREAEREVLQLPPVAEAIRNSIRAGQLTPAAKADYAERILAINLRVTPLEQQFSQTLAAGAREVQVLLLQATLAVAATLLAIGVLFAWSVSRELRVGIQRLREGAMRVAGGDLTQTIRVRSQDELGELATVFNSMMAARREAEAALLTANQFREKVMENATNAIYTMDLEGRFTTANRRTCEITGYALSELLGRTWASMVREADLPALHAGFVSTIEGREPISNREILMRQRQGSEVSITFSIAPLRRDGVIFGVVGAAEDITERKRAEVELQSRAEELGRSNQELEQFAYVASHDLQEPLRTVTGFTQLLSRRYRGQLDTEADEFIGYITDGVARMKSLIEDLLAYSRVQRTDTILVAVALDGVLDAALANLHAAIDSAGATITREPLPALPVDARQFTQLFQNLVGNAIKFRREHPPRIHIRAEQVSAQWQFSLRDNGIGIRAEAAGRVFELFQRLHSRDEYEGNGIGLTICKKIVELHGGRIWVVPAVAGGEGTEFRFTLPA